MTYTFYACKSISSADIKTHVNWAIRLVIVDHHFIFRRSHVGVYELTLKVLNFWKFTSYCNFKILWSGMGEVVPARTSPTLHPPSPPTVHQLSRLAL